MSEECDYAGADHVKQKEKEQHGQTNPWCACGEQQQEREQLQCCSG